MSTNDYSKKRFINDQFAIAIKERIQKKEKLSKKMISFRNDEVEKKERDVVQVPTELLRFRKDNGRIASDVISFENENHPLNEDNDEDQKILRDFLLKKDQEKTQELKNSIIHSGQKEPAIITCDGYLINGNRRKMVLEKLQEEHPSDEKYKWMNVVILPGKDEDSPTIREINEIENRYQLQRDGKAEYSPFDRALSFKQKINQGITFEEQLRDDPNYANLLKKDFKKEMQKIYNTTLGPLECVDSYLKSLNREGMYNTISTNANDKEGRWAAFEPFYKFNKELADKSKLIQKGIDEEEVGEIIDVAFKLIRKQNMGSIGLRPLLRQFPNYVSNIDSKKELLKICEIENNLEDKDNYDSDGKKLDLRKIDQIWGRKNHDKINQHVHVAIKNFNVSSEAETPLSLLESALKKLNHNKLNLKNVYVDDLPKMKFFIKEIKETVEKLENEWWTLEKNKEKLQNKFKN